MKRGAVIAVVIAIAAAIGVFAWSRRDAATSSAGGGSAVALGSRSARAQTRIRAPVGTRAVRGHVVHAGRRLEGATVWLAMGALPIAQVTSGTDGVFEVKELPAGRYTVNAFTAELAGRSVEVDLRFADREGVELRLHGCARPLAGSVVDASGGPIVGARVTALGAFALSDASGRFRLCTENAGIQVVARADGYAAEQRVLAPGMTAVDFALRPEALLAGRTVARDGRAVPFALVVARPDNGDPSALGGSAYSDEDGAFELHGLGAGYHAVSASAEGFAMVEPLDVGLELGGGAPVTLVLEPLGKIRGLARLADRTPVKDVEIAWHHESGHGGAAKTDQAGVFQIDSVVLGEGQLYTPDHEIAEARRTVGSEPIELVLAPRDQYTIRGRVVVENRVVPDARVLQKEVTSSEGDLVRTDASGMFEIVTRHRKTTLSAESDDVGMASEPVVIEMTPVERRKEGVELVLTIGASAAGVVVDEQGAPVAGASVWLVGAPRLALQTYRVRGLAVTDTQGAFHVPMLDPGTHRIRVSLFGVELARASGPEKVDVMGPSAKIEGLRIVVKLQRATLDGTVVDGSGAPVVDATIEVRNRGGIATLHRTDQAGAFSAPAIAGETYRVGVRSKAGHETLVEDVEQGAPVRIVLPGPGRVKLVCSPHRAKVDLFPANAVRRVGRCGETLARVPAGALFVQLREFSADKPRAMASGEVVSDQELALTLGEVPAREVALTVTGGGKPVAQAVCIVDQAWGGDVTTNTASITDADGTTRAQTWAFPARVLCFPPQGSAWSAGRARIAADQDAVAIELPPRE